MGEAGEVALWIHIAVPACLVVIMGAMGLELGLADFRRVIEQPLATVVGLTGQLLLLPALGFGLAFALGVGPELAVGMVILVACPGGAPSNVFTWLAGANTALSILLTALSSLVTIVTIPLWVGLGLDLFLGESAALRLPLGRTFAQLIVVTLVPVGFGMALRAARPQLVSRLVPRVKRCVGWLFGGVLVVLVASEWKSVSTDLAQAVPAALGLVVLALGTAAAAARLAGLDRDDVFTISIEVGLQNGALATLIVVSLLEQPRLLAFPGVYPLVSFVPIAAWAFAHRRIPPPPRGGRSSRSAR
jgi:BASS family bile acid:Na+ symporter